MGISELQLYQVALEEGRLWRCHLDQLRRQVADHRPQDTPLTMVSEAVNQLNDCGSQHQSNNIGPRQPEPEVENLAENSELEGTPLVRLLQRTITASSASETRIENLVSMEALAAPPSPVDFSSPAIADTQPRWLGCTHWCPAYLRDYIE